MLPPTHQPAGDPFKKQTPSKHLNPLSLLPEFSFHPKLRGAQVNKLEILLPKKQPKTCQKANVATNIFQLHFAIGMSQNLLPLSVMMIPRHAVVCLVFNALEFSSDTKL